MTNTDIFDVLVVYSHEIANSASTKAKQPFEAKSPYASYNKSYEFLLSECAKNGFQAAFTTSQDIIGPGKVKSYWTFEKGQWLAHLNYAYSEFIFDKAAARTAKLKKRKDLLFSDKHIHTFSNPKMSALFNDKLNTYKSLPESSIPTVAVNSHNQTAIINSLKELQNLIKAHPNTQDFSTDVILKDQFGLSGDNLFKINDNFVSEISSTLKLHKNTSFIIQPFLKCNKSNFMNHSGFIDFRLVYFGSRLLQTYIRVATKGNFKCNEHQGGNLIYIKRKQLPTEVIIKSKDIVNKLKFPNSLYALDFMRSNNGNTYLIEGNSSPGLDWNDLKKINETKTKKLISFICEEIAMRISAKHIAAQKPLNISNNEITPVVTLEKHADNILDSN